MRPTLAHSHTHGNKYLKTPLLLFFLAVTVFSFSQTAGAGVTDVDGNNYQTVIIGSQEWMKENLRVTKYSNGEIIPNVIDNVEWSSLLFSLTGAWAHCSNDSQYENTYGKLYNWYVVSDSRNVCPIGWHVPTDGEWTILTDYLGGEAVAGGKMKSTSTQYWSSPNTNATNESGFSGLPGGYRGTNGSFYLIGNGGTWWSSTEFNLVTALSRGLGYIGGSLDRDDYDKRVGFSLRCLKGLPPLGVIELNSDSKKLLKIIDLMGKETEEKPNTVLIYIYTDGSIERKYFIN